MNNAAAHTVLSVLKLAIPRRKAGLVDRFIEETGCDLTAWDSPGSSEIIYQGYYDSQDSAIRAKNDITSAITSILPDNFCSATIEQIENKDWSEAWKEHFYLEKVSDRIVVKPSWRTFQSSPGDCIIEIDPGMSFGTGLHPTTRSCLRFIDQLSARFEKASFLDVGCGSGILSIAAAKLGFTDITAIDNDPVAISTAVENFKRNGVSGKISCKNTGLENLPLPGRTFDVVAANIYAHTLEDHVREIIGCTAGRPPAVLVLSGILVGQYNRVRETYESAGFAEFSSQTDSEWKSGIFGRLPRDE